MNIFLRTLAIPVLSLLVVSSALAEDGRCVKIASGQLLDSAGNQVKPGVDGWGYDYVNRYFEGRYCHLKRGNAAQLCKAFPDHHLTMDWNEAWLSSLDCNGDGKLDRHAGYPSYRDSGAWLHTTIARPYLTDDGRRCEELHETTYMAAPFDAVLRDGSWYDAAGDLLGPVIWGDFYVSEDYFTDVCD